MRYQTERLHGHWEYRPDLSGTPYGVALILAEGSAKCGGELPRLHRSDPFQRLDAGQGVGYRFPSDTNTPFELEGDGLLIRSDALPMTEEIMEPISFVDRGTIEENNSRLVTRVFDKGMVIGETVHQALGGWSSWPPHPFEIWHMGAPGWAEVYPPFDEIFYYRTRPQAAWALQIRKGWFAPSNEAEPEWCDGVTVVTDGSILRIPLGFHPVVVQPGATLYYLWAYIGGGVKE